MSARRPLREQLRLPLTREAPHGATAFVRSASNAYAVDALAAWPDSAGQVMAICGPAGCGKSHLAAIWAERVGAVPLNGAEAALADPLELEGRPVLLDIAQDADDETLFHLINLAQQDGGALLMVSRPSPRRLAGGRARPAVAPRRRACGGHGGPGRRGAVGHPAPPGSRNAASRRETE